jgi:hypothetical protein
VWRIGCAAPLPKSLLFARPFFTPLVCKRGQAPVYHSRTGSHPRVFYWQQQGNTSGAKIGVCICTRSVSASQCLAEIAENSGLRRKRREQGQYHSKKHEHTLIPFYQFDAFVLTEGRSSTLKCWFPGYQSYTTIIGTRLTDIRAIIHVTVRFHWVVLNGKRNYPAGRCLPA